MTGVLIRTREERRFPREDTGTHREKTDMRQRRPRSVGCTYKPRNAKDFRQPPESRRKAWNRFSLRASRRDTLVSF